MISLRMLIIVWLKTKLFLFNLFVKPKPHAIAIVSCFISSSLLAIEPAVDQPDTIEQTRVNIAFTLSMPPYLSEDFGAGIERDIIFEALKDQDLALSKIFNVTYMRAIKLLKENKVDGIVSNRGNHVYKAIDAQNRPSVTTLNYIDCAITLKERNFTLVDIRDYADKVIWAFKTAKTTLGPEFETMATNNPHYTENFDQQKQIEMIGMKRIDVAISDRNIFEAKVRSLENFNPNQFAYHQVAQPTSRVIRFLNSDLLEKFNRGLHNIKANGKYETIFLKYKKTYRPNCQ